MMRTMINSLIFLLLCRAGLGACYVLDSEDQNKPLFLTPYINKGEIKQGQEAAKVAPLLENVESYSGFLTVDEKLDKNLFFWYFPAENQTIETSEHTYSDTITCTVSGWSETCVEKISESAVIKDTTPVMVWLQGGPGGTSMYGLLLENGPYQLLEDGSLKQREHRWTKKFHMIYIDNPVGSGFSFASPGVFDTNEVQVSQDLYNALLQFFKLFPNLADNELFIAGESYAGRYIPVLGLRIHKSNPAAQQKINLAGLLIGDGMVDNEFSIYGDYLAQHGLIDLQDLPEWEKTEAKYRQALREKDFQTANSLEENMMLGVSATGVSFYNFLEEPSLNTDLELLSRFFRSADVRRKIHVGDLAFKPENSAVYSALWKGDFFMKISSYTEELLNTYRVMHYNGQLDIILHYPMAEQYTNSLQFDATNEFQNAPKRPWNVDGDIAGYVKSGGNLYLVMVRDAGHMVPKDQPKWALDLVIKFVNNDL